MSVDTDNPVGVLQQEALAWVTLMVSGRVTADDLARMEQWKGQSPLHAEALVRALKFRRLVAAQNTFDGHPPFWQKPTTRRAAFAATFAAVGGLAVVRPPLSLWPSLAQLSSDYRTAIGEQKHVVLADGLSLDLNTQTSIGLRVKPGHPGIDLVAGEVLVKSDLPASTEFTAFTGNCRVSARRAVFDMHNYGGNIRVICLNGTVVVNAGSSSVSLGPHRQLLVSDSSVSQPAAVDADVATAWQHGHLVFHDESLSTIVAEINRYRPGRIVIMRSGLGDRRFNGEVRIQHVDRVVAELVRLSNAKATTLPGGIVVLT